MTRGETEQTDPAPPLVVVLTGPSGVGKDALVNRAHERDFPLIRPATMTTRAPRAGEVEGEHHYFVDRATFLANVEAGELLEHAEVYGNLYGVPRKSVRAALGQDGHVVIRVDVQGAESLHDLLPEALFVALEPASLDGLEARLAGRGTETRAEVERRLEVAREEIDRARRFCLPLINEDGNLDGTVDAFIAMLDTERARAGRPEIVV